MIEKAIDGGKAAKDAADRFCHREIRFAHECGKFNMRILVDQEC
jgi:hypothetical protein